MANKPNNPSLWSKAKSMAKQKYDVYPCVPMDSQALTKEGWKYYHELKVGDNILAYNQETNKNEWTPILDLQFFKDAPIIRLFKKQTNFDIKCTPNHKWVLAQPNSKYPDNLVEAKDITKRMSIKVSAELSTDTQDLDLNKFFKKDSWVKNILNMSIPQIQSYFASGIVYDGHDKGLNKKETKQTYGFSQKELDHGLAMEIAAVLLGYRVCSVIKKHNPSMTTWTFIRRNTENTSNLHKEDAGISDVWCPTTKFGTWVMKQNGYITITGNSAYANGWAAKWYKSKGGTWRKAKEGGNYYRHMFKESGNYNDCPTGQVRNPVTGKCEYTYGWSTGTTNLNVIDPTIRSGNKESSVGTTVPSTGQGKPAQYNPVPIKEQQEIIKKQNEQIATQRAIEQKEAERQRQLQERRYTSTLQGGKGAANEAGLIGIPDASTYRTLATNMIPTVTGGTAGNFAMEIANTIPSAAGELLTGRHDYYTAFPNIRRSFLNATNTDLNKYGLRNQRTLGNAVFPDNPAAAFALDLPIDLITTRGAGTLLKQGTKYGVKYLPKIGRAILPTRLDSPSYVTNTFTDEIPQRYQTYRWSQKNPQTGKYDVFEEQFGVDEIPTRDPASDSYQKVKMRSLLRQRDGLIYPITDYLRTKGLLPREQWNISDVLADPVSGRLQDGNTRYWLNKRYNPSYGLGDNKYKVESRIGTITERQGFKPKYFSDTPIESQWLGTLPEDKISLSKRFSLGPSMDIGDFGLDMGINPKSFISNVNTPPVSVFESSPLHQYLNRKAHLKQLKNQGLIDPNSPIDEYAKSLEATDDITRRALENATTRYRSVDPDIQNASTIYSSAHHAHIPYEEKLKSISDYFSKHHSLDVNNPAHHDQIAEIMATHVPKESYGYRSGVNYLPENYQVINTADVPDPAFRYGPYQYEIYQKPMGSSYLEMMDNHAKRMSDFYKQKDHGYYEWIDKFKDYGVIYPGSHGQLGKAGEPLFQIRKRLLPTVEAKFKMPQHDPNLTLDENAELFKEAQKKYQMLLESNRRSFGERKLPYKKGGKFIKPKNINYRKY